MANMSAALAIGALADQIETNLKSNLEPGPNPAALEQISAACSRLTRIDPKAGALADRMAMLAAIYYGDGANSRRPGGTDLNFIEMRGRLLGAIRARADAYLAAARF
jgi:hypothetical protein